MSLLKHLRIYCIITSALFILLTITTGWFENPDYNSGNNNHLMSDPAAAFLKILKASETLVEDAKGNIISSEQLIVERKWVGHTCKISIKNSGKVSLYPANVIVFNIKKHGFNPYSAVYGEGFQMLDQKGGILDSLVHIGPYADEKHYKIPNVHGLSTAYGVFSISNNIHDHVLLGFTSCNRFIGRISYDALQLLVSFDTESLELKPGEIWQMEDFIFLNGDNRSHLFDQLATEISVKHPIRKVPQIPTGWCSWYCYGPKITHDIMQENLVQFSQKLPALKYIQLDDGYQPFMGDWLDYNPAYGDLQKTLNAIKSKGFEPAIWVAPFVAEKRSRIFREHPDWFIKDKDGSPLESSKIGFGGWRNGPWYALDGTHPKVQEYLQHLFSYMRNKWGINYFKLDANYWGAIHGGVHYDKTATRIEAYRSGMKAILKGCDANTVVLGCNAPIWPSLGLVTAMRTSGDINRDWKTIKGTAYENLCRSWQNGKLWDADPDCVVLANDADVKEKKRLLPNQWMFHATAIHATGGLILSGDKAALLQEKEIGMLQKLLKTTGKGAQFKDNTMAVGVTDLNDRQYYYFFNWGEKDSIDLSVQLKTNSLLVDFWSGEKLGIFKGKYSIQKLPPHSARLIEARPAMPRP